MEIPTHHQDDWIKTLSQFEECKSEGYYTVQENAVSHSNYRQNNEKSQNSKQIGINEQSHVDCLTYQYNFNILYSGYLEKKTLNMTWTQRFFCLSSTRLFYYIDHHQIELKGCFNFGSLLRFNLKIVSDFPQITLKVDTTLPCPLNNNQQKIVLRLRFHDQKQHRKWTQLLLNTMQLNRKRIDFFPKLGQQILIDTHTLVGQKQNYWNRITISHNQLISYADHLDLVFFRSKGAFAALNRFFMRSYYDHIGILIKGEINQLYIFQAIQSRGVWVIDWQTLLEHFEESYEEIGYRKIFIPQAQKICPQNLEDYINTLIGKKYELSFSKLFSGNLQPIQIQASKINPNSIAKFQSTNSYFCSQLVADVYMKFGLLKKGKSHQYWPKEFQRGIQLQKGSFLSSMMNVQMKK